MQWRGKRQEERVPGRSFPDLSHYRLLSHRDVARPVLGRYAGFRYQTASEMACPRRASVQELRRLRARRVMEHSWR